MGLLALEALGLVLLLAYVLAMWIGGWVVEGLARVHFHRARAVFARRVRIRLPNSTVMNAPQGELLTLDTFDDRNKLAIYKAPASSCSRPCVLKKERSAPRTTRAGTFYRYVG